MSEYVRVKGQIKKVEIKGSIEETAKEYLNSKDITDLPKYYEYWLEYAEDEELLVRIGDDLYEVKFDVNGEGDCLEFADIEKEGDSYNFHMLYYNGRTGWAELLSDGLPRCTGL